MEVLFHIACLQLRSPVRIIASCDAKMASRSDGDKVVDGGRYAEASIRLLWLWSWMQTAVASSPVIGGRGNESLCRVELTRSITSPPKRFLSSRYTLYPGMENWFVGWSLVSLMAATSMLLAWRKSWSSAFLPATELAFHVSKVHSYINNCILYLIKAV